MSARYVMEWLCLWCFPTLGIAALAGWLLNWPALRAERARLLLSALELGLRMGRSPEQAVIEISGTRDGSLGARFHLLAAWIRSGLRFSEALARLPSLAPARTAAMLSAGEEAGIFPGALRAAQRGTNLPDAQMRAALSCQIVMLFILNPLVLAMLPFFLLKVFPILQAILAGTKQSVPFAMQFLIASASWIFAIQVLSILFLYLGAIFYLGGNRFTRWLEAGLFPISAWLALKIPWKRKRLQRDFAAMFALLLDAGLPESRALELAAAATSNEIFQARAAESRRQLEQGVALPKALAALDPPGEFIWRLANALQRNGKYSEALEGWFETLDAEADAKEQAAGDYLSTCLLIINGLIVALIIGTVMQCVYRSGMYAFGP